MKILNVNHILDPVSGGGTAERTFEMSQQLINYGDACTILTLAAGDNSRTLRGGRIVTLPIISRRFLIPKYLFKGIIREVKSTDVVHLMGHWTLLNALVYLAARLYRKPYVFCPAGALPVFGRSKWLKRIYNFVIGYQIARHASRCIAITDVERTHFSDYGISPEDVIVIPNAIATPVLPPKNQNKMAEKFGVGQKHFILFVGRLNYIKGPDFLVSAFCSIMDQYPNFDLVVAGPDDGMMTELSRIVAERNAASRVHFVGYIGGIDKFQAYQAADVLAIPSRQEAMSLVVLEAGAVGTPSIFTDQCGLNQFAKEDCGWMVSASVEGLKQGLQTALTSDEVIRDKGQKVSVYVQKNYSWSAVIQIYQKMYRDLGTL